VRIPYRIVEVHYRRKSEDVVPGKSSRHAPRAVRLIVGPWRQPQWFLVLGTGYGVLGTRYTEAPGVSRWEQSPPLLPGAASPACQFDRRIGMSVAQLESSGVSQMIC
jgi:hypothetical protein